MPTVPFRKDSFFFFFFFFLSKTSLIFPFFPSLKALTVQNMSMTLKVCLYFSLLNVLTYSLANAATQAWKRAQIRVLHSNV